MKKDNKKTSNFIFAAEEAIPLKDRAELLKRSLFAGAALSFSALAGIFWAASLSRMTLPAGVFLLLIPGFLWGALLTLPGRRGVLIRSLSAALLLLAGFLFRDALADGFGSFLNSFLDAFGALHPYPYPYFRVTAEGEVLGRGILAGALFAGSLAILLAGYLIRFGNRLLLGIFMTALLCFQAVSGLYASLPANAAFLLSLFLLWQITQGKSGKKGEAIVPSGAVFTGLLMILGLLITAGLLTLGYKAFKTSERSFTVEGFSVLKERILKAAEDRLYKGSAEVLPLGDLSENVGFSPDGSEALKVIMTEPGSYYLKGFTGSYFEDNQWSEGSSEELWKSRGVFYKLHEEGFYGQQQLSQAVLSLDPAEETLINTITIENIGANRKYTYVPYELYASQEELSLSSGKLGDERVKGVGAGVSYEAVTPSVTHFPTLAAAMLEEEALSEAGLSYREQEALYNEFVYDTYTKVPAALSDTLYLLLGDYEHQEGEKHAAYTEAKQDILYLLTQDYTYSEEAAELPQGANAIKDFLVNSKKGSSVQFASAAVMLFRYFGIPARYVEGYLITPEDAEKMTAGEAYSLDNTHAHAWAEYYQDGVGWLPFEITPAYLNVMERAENFQDITGVSGIQEEKPEEDEEQGNEEEPEAKEDFDWLLLAEILLVIFIAVMLLRLLLLFLWVIRMRRETRKMKEQFSDPELRISIRALFAYAMNLLAVSGLKTSNASLYEYREQVEAMFGAETGAEYEAAVTARQKAVYSNQEMTKEEQTQLMTFKDKLWEMVYQKGSLLQRLKLKFVFYL